VSRNIYKQAFMKTHPVCYLVWRLRKTIGAGLFVFFMGALLVFSNGNVLVNATDTVVDLRSYSADLGFEAQSLTEETYVDDFSTDSPLWTLYCNAYRDPTNQYLVLTEPNGNLAGAAYFKIPFTNAFTANFSFSVGGGSGGDGFTMFFYKQNYTTMGEGGSLGFNDDTAPIPGYAIEFDGWQNIGRDPSPPNEPGDPSSNHIALIKNWMGNHLVYVNDSRTEDNKWHDVSVVVGESYVGVFVDNEFVLRWDGTFNKTYGWFGFTGATGSATNWHLIDNFTLTNTVTEPPLTPTRPNAVNATRFPSTLSIVADASSSEVGSTVNINGRISNEECNALGAGKTVVLSYAVGSNASWVPLGSGETNAAGEYCIQWVPWASGTFMLKAEWNGDLNYTGACNSTRLSFLPVQNQKVFCVESNSTVTGLAFNDANLTLGFTVSGPSGTTGYTRVAVAKSLVADISGIRTLVDGEEVNFTATSVDENWMVALSYSHSTHQVSIDLQTQGKERTNSQPSSAFEVAAITTVVVIAVASAIIMQRKQAPK
jgi:hypothetical protein